MFNRRTRIIVAVLLVSALTITILDLRGGRGPFASVRTALSSVLSVGQRGAAVIVDPVLSVVTFWGTWAGQREEIARLKTENARLADLVRRSQDDRARADALDAMLRVAGVGRYRVIPAEVIAVGPKQDFAWTVTIDAGRADGIEANMTVINGDGLVGRVLEATRGSATVVLLTDASASVGARVAGSEEIGIVSGTGRQDSLELQLLDPLAPVNRGEALVTFGSKAGRPYAPGIPIGEVVEISGTAGQLARVATVRPFVNVSTLTIVGVVVRPPRVDPRDSVLPSEPAPPAPMPTASPGIGPSGGPTSAPSSGAPSNSASARAPQVEQPATPEPDVAPMPEPSGEPRGNG